MSDDAATFEHPLNERMRMLLRLEFLLETIARAAEGERRADSRSAVEGIINVLGVLDRGDVRSELIKELDRMAGGLSRTAAEGQQVEEDMAACRELLARLGAPEASLGQDLRADELLSAVGQRHVIGAGTCGFDVPAFHRWLSQPHSSRYADLQRWQEGFADLQAAVSLILRLQRERSSMEPIEAEQGQWQYRPPMDSRPIQLLRVRLPGHPTLFPEIGGNRHLITLRLMAQPDTVTRPEPTTENVTFHLAICDL